MNLLCFGLNHRTAPIEARERFVGHARTEAFLRDLGCHEVLLLTTCNRVEIYAATDRSILSEHLAQALRIGGGASSREDLDAFYRMENTECARHLFRVASGLDSMVVGETEILGQTKRAYENARASGSAGPLCISSVSVPFGWRNKCAQRRRLPVVQCRWDRSRWIWLEKFLVICEVARFW